MANTIFTGSSSYSNDFVNLVTRATAIASLPIKQLQADKTKLTDQSTALSGLDAKFQAIQSAINNVADALSGSSFQASVSDPTKVGVNLSDGAMEGSYSVDVVDAGAYATSMSASKWLAPAGATRAYRLSIGPYTYAINPSDNSAASVASAINNKFGDQIRATVVNVGSSSAVDYRISLQATSLGDLKPALYTGPATPTSKQTGQVSGSDAKAASVTASAWDSNPALTYELSLSGQTYSIAPADNNVQSVADAINSAYGTQVTASVVNVGTEETPDLRLSLVATGPGNVQPDLIASDGVTATSLQNQTVAGSDTLAVSRSTEVWTTDPGPTLTYELSIGGVKYSLAPTDNSADAIVNDINSKHGDKVTAAVVDLGNGSSHDYRIQLTAKNPGDVKPDLIVSQVDLQKQQTSGALARYIVNNSGIEVSSAARNATIATGVSISLLAKDNGVPVSITVTRPTSQLSSALAAFTDAYNAAVDELDSQRTSSDSVLSGQSLLVNLSRSLSSIGTYSSSSGLSTLASLGLDLDKTGHLTFSSFTLMAADLGSSSGVTAFLGSTTSGFIKAASDALKSVQSTGTGVLSQAKSSLQDQLTRLTDTIADKQEAVDRLTERLQAQMAAADALIASMEQQYTYMSNMISAMRTASEQYQ